jgi:hypothetical protein
MAYDWLTPHQPGKPIDFETFKARFRPPKIPPLLTAEIELIVWGALNRLMHPGRASSNLIARRRAFALEKIVEMRPTNDEQARLAARAITAHFESSEYLRLATLPNIPHNVLAEYGSKGLERAAAMDKIMAKLTRLQTPKPPKARGFELPTPANSNVPDPLKPRWPR